MEVKKEKGHKQASSTSLKAAFTLGGVKEGHTGGGEGDIGTGVVFTLPFSNQIS